MSKTFTSNNFDLIRLLAATQVATVHAFTYFNIEVPTLIRAIPGVPIFFFVSGFLISKSYERSENLYTYCKKRALRIYPALFACSLFTITIIYFSGYLDNASTSWNEITIWQLSQVTFFQFYNPEFLRNFGTGVINGSLWTISVELQFYILIPLIYKTIVQSTNKQRTNFYLSLLIILFAALHHIKYRYESLLSDQLAFKLFSVSFLPWIYMFLIGVIAQTNFPSLHRVVKGKAPLILPIYLVAQYLTTTHFNWNSGNGINPLLFLLLSIAILSVAYTKVNTSSKTLKGNDISYGIYIYHMPIINLIIHHRSTPNSIHALIAILDL